MATTRLLSGFKLVFAAVLLVGITGCEKWVRPSKVERIITKDSWRITNLTVGGQNIEDQFSGTTLGFGEKGSLTVLGVEGVQGAWELGINKKPTTLYISGLTDLPYFNLNDDWEVLTCSKSKITMQSENGTYTHKLTLVKVEVD